MSNRVTLQRPLQFLACPKLRAQLAPLSRLWLTIFAAFTTGVAAWELYRGGRLPWVLSAAVTAGVVCLIYLVQRRLAAIAIEAIIQRKNEGAPLAIADWLCLFPLFSTSYCRHLRRFAQSRTHHPTAKPVAPDTSQGSNVSNLAASPPGDGQAQRGGLARTLSVSWLWQHFTLTGDHSLAVLRNRQARWPDVVHWSATFALVLAAESCSHGSTIRALLWTVVLVWLVVSGILGSLPAGAFRCHRVRSRYCLRMVAISRWTFKCLLVGSLYAGKLWTDKPFPGYFLLLWVTPLFASLAVPAEKNLSPRRFLKFLNVGIPPAILRLRKSRPA